MPIPGYLCFKNIKTIVKHERLREKLLFHGFDSSSRNSSGDGGNTKKAVFGSNVVLLRTGRREDFRTWEFSEKGV